MHVFLSCFCLLRGGYWDGLLSYRASTTYNRGATDQVTNSVDLVARELELDTDRVEAASRLDPYL